MHDTFEFSCDGEWFNELVKPMVDKGIDYTSEVIWTDAWHRSIKETCSKYNADLVSVSDYATEDGRTDLTTPNGHFYVLLFALYWSFIHK